MGLLANFVIHILIDDCLAFSLSDGNKFLKWHLFISGYDLNAKWSDERLAERAWQIFVQTRRRRLREAYLR